MREHPGEKVTQYHVCDIFRQAYEKVASISNATSGFAKTGIWPVDREVFTDADFAASDNLTAENGMKEAQQTLDVVEELVDEEGLHENDPVTQVQTSTCEQTVTQPTTVDLPMALPAGTPSTSRTVPVSTLSSNGPMLCVTLEQISPLPTPATQKQQRRQSKGAQKAMVLTESPYKNDLETKKKTCVNRVQKKRDKPAPKKKVQPPKKKLQVGPQTKEAVVEVEVNEEEWYCFMCDQSLVEDMVKCDLCYKWSHERCAGANFDKGMIGFICDLCKA